MQSRTTGLRAQNGGNLGCVELADEGGQCCEVVVYAARVEDLDLVVEVVKILLLSTRSAWVGESKREACLVGTRGAGALVDVGGQVGEGHRAGEAGVVDVADVDVRLGQERFLAVRPGLEDVDVADELVPLRAFESQELAQGRERTDPSFSRWSRYALTSTAWAGWMV